MQASAGRALSGSDDANRARSGRTAKIDIDCGGSPAGASIPFQLAFARSWFGRGRGSGAVRVSSLRAAGKKNFHARFDFSGPNFRHQLKRPVCSGWFDAGCLSHARRRITFSNKFQSADAANPFAISRYIAMAKSKDRRNAPNFLPARRSLAHSSFRTIKL